MLPISNCSSASGLLGRLLDEFHNEPFRAENGDNIARTISHKFRSCSHSHYDAHGTQTYTTRACRRLLSMQSTACRDAMAERQENEALTKWNLKTFLRCAAENQPDLLVPERP